MSLRLCAKFVDVWESWLFSKYCQRSAKLNFWWRESDSFFWLKKVVTRINYLIILVFFLCWFVIWNITWKFFLLLYAIYFRGIGYYGSSQLRLFFLNQCYILKKTTTKYCENIFFNWANKTIKKRNENIGISINRFNRYSTIFI